MKETDIYLPVDESIFRLSRKIKPEYYVQPINEREQKDKFLKGYIQEPEFSYREPEYNIKESQDELWEMKIPRGEFSDVYENKKEEMLLQNMIISGVGDEDLVRSASSLINGLPERSLVSISYEMADQILSRKEDKKKDSRAVKQRFEKALEDCGILDWDVDFSEKSRITVYPSEKKILLPEDRKFSEKEIERLSVHEIGVHALRAQNGYSQPLKLFAIGFPGYLSTEEGMASYFEVVRGTSDDQILKRDAGRVIATDSLLCGDSFAETFNILKKLEFGDDESWNISTGAHRGGGYVKDHVYLDGNRKITGYAIGGGDMECLYVGKIGLSDVELVNSLLQREIISRPKHLPWFMEHKI